MEMSGKYFYESESIADTQRLAAEIGNRLWPGSVLALDGDLGAGKTAFTQGLAKALDIRETVNSPTFTIIKEYEGPRFPLYHMDVYRISEEEAEELGLDEYFYGKGITVVEWSGKIQGLMPEEYLSITIGDLGGGKRRFCLQPRGMKYGRLCGKLKENGVLS